MRAKQFWGLCVVTAIALTPLACNRHDAVGTDAAVAGNVKQELSADRELANAASAIQVTAHDGVVTLTGRVPNEAAKREAADIADDVDGVDRVDNQLVVAMADTGARRGIPPANRPAPPPAPNAAPAAPPEGRMAPAEPAPAPAGQ
jgi:hypothetical protein